MSDNRHVYAALLDGSDRTATRARLRSQAGFSRTLRLIVIVNALLAVILPLLVIARAHASTELEPVVLPSDGQAGLWMATPDPDFVVRAPTVDTDVVIDVHGMIVRTRVTQTFENPGDFWTEAVYVYPLPEDAAVDRLRMMVGERVVEGRIDTRDAAREAYEQALTDGRQASLVEQERPNIFTTSVANIGPGESITVEITYQETAGYDGGQFSLRFPMVVAPRYIPDGTVEGTITGVSANGDDGPAIDSLLCISLGELQPVSETPEDWWRITPPVRNPEDGPINPITLTVHLDAGMPLASVDAPFHDVDIRESASLVTVSLAGDEEHFADGDFELNWRPVLGSEPTAAMFHEAVDGDHFIHVMVMPTAADAATDFDQPREVIYVIDTSGSMDGESIVQARAALQIALEALDPADRFNVIEFNDHASTLFRGAVEASERNVGMAIGFVQALRAEGGTEILEAMQAALDDDAPEGYVRQVVFITDGSIGNEQQIFNYIHRSLGASRLFTVGIGSAPNSFFMTEAAELGRGTFTYIGSTNQVQERMDALFTKLENPVMTDLTVKPAGGGLFDLADTEIWPNPIPDLYQGEPVTFTMRVDDPDQSIVVGGLRAGQPWRQVISLSDAEDSSGVGAVWAYAKIDALMDTLAFGADPEEVEDAVTEVALAHQVVSRYTSLVAETDEVVVPEGARVASFQIETNLPRGWVFESVFGGIARERDQADPSPSQEALQAPLPAPTTGFSSGGADASASMRAAPMVSYEEVDVDDGPVLLGDAPTGLGELVSMRTALILLACGASLALVALMLAVARRRAGIRHRRPD
ncbi:MAG: marine proteobacterial sortase target protein [Alphaproteobacteria bacterium]